MKTDKLYMYSTVQSAAGMVLLLELNRAEWITCTEKPKEIWVWYCELGCLPAVKGRKVEKRGYRKIEEKNEN